MICPECASKDILTNSQLGEVVCRNCGLMLEDSMPDISIYREGTSITKPLAKNGKIIHKGWLMTSKMKNIERAQNIISKVCTRLNLPKHVNAYAYNLYADAVNKNILVGRNKDHILYACIYASCNINNLSKTADEIMESSHIKSKAIFKAYSVIQRKLQIRSSLFEPIDLLPKAISRLGLSQKCLTEAILIMNKSRKVASGKNPKSMVAAVIYIAAKRCNEKITQRQLANKIGVHEVTIRRVCKEIEV